MTHRRYIAGALLCGAALVSGCGTDDEAGDAADAGAVDAASVDDAATDDAAVDESGAMALTSVGVEGGVLLDAYRCEMKDANGSSDSLPLAWTDVPDGTGALAVTMHHYPMGSTMNPSSYFSLWDIDPSVTAIAHGAADDGPWFMGANKDGTGIGYTSPCSPSGGGHTYTLTLYALSATPGSLPAESSLEIGYSELVAAFEAVDVLDTATLEFIDGAAE